MRPPHEDLADQFYPRAVNDEDNAAVWQRHLDITRMSTADIESKIHGLRSDRLVPDVDIEIRRVRFTPSLMLYLINNSAVLSAPYVPVRRPVYLTAHAKAVEAIDLLSIGASFTYDAKDDDPHSPASEKVDDWRKWFNATWDLVAQ